MYSMSVTLDTSQFEMSVLKYAAVSNMPPMSVTLDTSQFEMSVLKERALMNISLMSVTCDTSHFEMSPLKERAFLNIAFMSVTFDTSHVPIGPCGPLEQYSDDSLRHASTASLSSARVFGENTVVGGGNGS